MSKYTENNPVVDAVQFSATSQVKIDNIGRPAFKPWQGFQVGQDGDGVHANVGGAVCRDGDWIVTYPNGEIKVIPSKDFSHLYTSVVDHA